MCESFVWLHVFVDSVSVIRELRICDRFIWFFVSLLVFAFSQTDQTQETTQISNRQGWYQIKILHILYGEDFSRVQLKVEKFAMKAITSTARQKSKIQSNTRDCNLQSNRKISELISLTLTWCHTPNLDGDAHLLTVPFWPFWWCWLLLISNLSISISCVLSSNLFPCPSKFTFAWLILIILNFLLSSNETVSHSTTDWSHFSWLNFRVICVSSGRQRPRNSCRRTMKREREKKREKLTLFI